MFFLKLIKVTIEGHIQVYTFRDKIIKYCNQNTTEGNRNKNFVYFSETFVKTFETNMDTHELERLECYLKDM